jgi:hypothetical protein
VKPEVTAIKLKMLYLLKSEIMARFHFPRFRAGGESKPTGDQRTLPAATRIPLRSLKISMIASAMLCRIRAL